MKLSIFEPDQKTLSSFDQEKYKILKDLYLKDKSYSCTFVSLNSVLSETHDIYDHYIFLPLKFTSFENLKKNLKKIPSKASIVFHLDGNFLFHSQEWISLFKILNGRNIKFVTSSSCHQKLVKNLVDSESQVYHLPVSIHSKPGVNKEKTTTFRSNLKVSDDEFVFLYHGPITRQSNILELTRLFIKLRTQLHLKVHLWIYGEFDDVAMPLIGKSQLNFEYYQQWQMMVDSFDAQDYIRYLGETDELNEKLIIESSDWGIYPTAIDSEDFNFSALKLLNHGLPLILSDWGSHFDFDFSGFIKRVSLVNDSPFHQVDLNHCAKIIIKIIQSNERMSLEQRTSLSQEVLSRSKPDQSLEELNKILQSTDKFSGFSELFLKVEKAFDQNPYAPFVDVSSFGAYNSNFKTIYESYTNNS